jgi:hypothetical protein
MTTNNAAVDWGIVLAWSLGHAILTALVGHTTVNAAVTYDTIRLGTGANAAHRWIGRCKACRKAHRVDGVLATGRTGKQDEQIVVSGARCYRTADHGSNATILFVSCCTSVSGQQRIEWRVKLQRVYDDHKPNRPRHECNAKCLASTGPACECKCKGANHGRSTAAA